MQNIAIIQQGTGRFLFSVPENVTLREGDRVKCDTKRGITDGIAFADSVWVDENVSQLIGKLMGAKFPLKPVVGKMEYQPFEKPEDKPAANPANKYEGMSNKELDLEMCAKKGACSATHSSHRKNDCPLLGMESCDITDANRAEVIEYLLAEDAEAEPKPEYWNGKVVCVESCDGDFTVGKVYEFVNGKVTDNDGIARLMGDKKLFKSVEEWNEACACLIARFIEFKGEAND